mmetsp:Transcript_11186/g.23610  ORF Transcript_11186/g.23610 Transcript_11186/m.23610 type:complete len:281 (+) Transcript_11186:1436-2278(+)
MGRYRKCSLHRSKQETRLDCGIMTTDLGNLFLQPCVRRQDFERIVFLFFVKLIVVVVVVGVVVTVVFSVVFCLVLCIVVAVAFHARRPFSTFSFHSVFFLFGLKPKCSGFVDLPAGVLNESCIGFGVLQTQDRFLHRCVDVRQGANFLRKPGVVKRNRVRVAFDSTRSAPHGLRFQLGLQYTINALCVARRATQLTTVDVFLEEGQYGILDLNIDQLNDRGITVGTVQTMRDHGQVVAQDRECGVVDSAHWNVGRRRTGRSLLVAIRVVCCCCCCCCWFG